LLLVARTQRYSGKEILVVPRVISTSQPGDRRRASPLFAAALLVVGAAVGAVSGWNGAGAVRLTMHQASDVLRDPYSTPGEREAAAEQVRRLCAHGIDALIDAHATPQTTNLRTRLEAGR